MDRYHGHAPLVGFSSALMTLSKTALYFLQGGRIYLAEKVQSCADGPEYFCGWCMIGHNTVKNLWIWTLTNVSLASGSAV